MAKAAQLAPAERRIHYERRRPEDTALYQLVQEHLETFLAQVEGETGAGLPKFVKAEFDAFLQRGIFAHGSGVTDSVLSFESPIQDNHHPSPPSTPRPRA